LFPGSAGAPLGGAVAELLGSGPGGGLDSGRLPHAGANIAHTRRMDAGNRGTAAFSTGERAESSQAEREARDKPRASP